MRDASGLTSDLVNGTLVGVVPDCAINKVIYIYVACPG